MRHLITNRVSAVIVVACAACVGTTAWSSLLAQAPVASTPARQVFFAKEIAPILHGCWSCHGSATRLSSLDLRTREGALQGGTRGPAIVPGRADESRLYRLVAGLERPAMPLGGTPLTPEQVAAVKLWIDQGAEWEAGDQVASAVPAAASDAGETREPPPGARDYWAFNLPAPSPVPSVSGGFEHPIDRFLEAKRSQKGLKVAPRADRLTLVRRAHLDLIGLPPTPRQVTEFVDDKTPGAWERLIDRLLASPQYGERWGRHWLDIARYADSSGYETDQDRPNAWRYRDYVVRSFNEDKPFDVFIAEQLAGDELDAKTQDSLIATYFLRAGPRVYLQDENNPQYRYDYLDDVIATVGKGLLGLTIQCARCHDHKFDPILQRDYYALQASLFGYVETTVPLAAPELVAAHEKAVAAIDARLAPLQAEVRKLEAPYRERLTAEVLKRDFPLNVQQAVAKPEAERTEGERLLANQVLRIGFQLPIDEAMTPEEVARKKELTQQIAAIEKERPQPLPSADIVTDGDYRFAPAARRPGGGRGAGSKPRVEGSFLHTGPGRYVPPPAHFLIRGDMNARGAAMNPGFPRVITYGDPPTELPPADGRTSGRRLALARWLTSLENPLTARVIANRIWSHHFGRGLVSTLENFGKMGERPTHPELLDWLALEFRRSGWSFKRMHRLIMTSAAYQMASAFDDAASAAADPANQLLWRYHVQRLEAEAIRDSIMAVAGTLDLTMGGPAVFPHVPEELLRLVSMTSAHGIYRNHPDGPAVWRRSIYAYVKRNLPFPLLQVFDWPDLNTAAGARLVSTVPTQALTLMNNAFVVKQAGLFADRVAREAGSRPRDQIDRAFRIALSRPPTAEEAGWASTLVDGGSLTDLTSVLLNSSEFLYRE